MRPSRSALRCSAWVALAAAIVVAVLPAVEAAELTVWVWSDVRQRQFARIIEWFQDEHPGVDVSLQLVSGGQDDFTEKLTLAIASGAPPDLTWMEGSAVREFAAQGLLLPVDDALAGLRFTPSDTEEMTFRGRMWGVPYHTTSRGLLKRTDFFEQAGLDPDVDPQSLDELWEWNRKLTKMTANGTYERVGFIPWGSNWGPPAWIWTFGGRLLDESGIRPTATYPANVRAFEWLRNWALNVGTPTPVPGGFSGFRQGTVAMNADSTTAAGQLLIQGVSFTTGRVPHPPGGRNGTWGGGQALSVPANAAQPEAAMRLLRFFGEPEVQIRRFREFPEALPASWEALQVIARELPPIYGPLLEQLPEARPRTPLWLDYYVGQLRPAESAVIRGEKTPQQALEDVQRFMVERFAEVFGTE